MMAFVWLIGVPAISQHITLSKEEMMFFTKEWTGERYPDGRPKVSDEILERMIDVSLEEAWSVCRNQGYMNQFTGDWKMIHEDKPFVGRALTTVYMPKRGQVMERMVEEGHKNGRVGAMNSWPIDELKKGDVYVADLFGKHVDGTLIGDNLGNSIYAKSGTGVVFNGSIRDLEGLEEIEGFNAYVKGFHPSYLQETMLMGLNVPIRIGEAVVFPGDVVLAKREGVVFIPPHLAERVVVTSEVVSLKDEFGHQMLREGKYTPGQIDTKWSEEIDKAFYSWLDKNPGKLKMPKERIKDFLEGRYW
jgi:regulator of RNase E activity RraA